MRVCRGRIGYPFLRYENLTFVKIAVPGRLPGRLVLAQAKTEKATVGAPTSGHLIKEAGI